MSIFFYCKIKKLIHCPEKHVTGLGYWMKDVEFSNNGEEGTDCPTILPEQFIVTKKELDPAVYEQFLAMLEQGFPAINYEELVQQGKQLVDNNLSIAQKKLALAQGDTKDPGQRVPKASFAC
ncbi:MAG: hypothetical protein D3921_14625 [Candidatus Electrothrix sp. AW1]|nr:hypothetical protein [Candidatus Electrothrix sp. AX1]MCI5183727.1 hypothetical protein [Candidatus Electrothrix gigas]